MHRAKATVGINAVNSNSRFRVVDETQTSSFFFFHLHTRGGKPTRAGETYGNGFGTCQRLCRKSRQVMKIISEEFHQLKEEASAFMPRRMSRKLDLNIVDIPEYTEALRNKGLNRTPEKRELLRLIQERIGKSK